MHHIIDNADESLYNKNPILHDVGCCLPRKYPYNNLTKPCPGGWITWYLQWLLGKNYSLSNYNQHWLKSILILLSDFPILFLLYLFYKYLSNWYQAIHQGLCRPVSTAMQHFNPLIKSYLAATHLVSIACLLPRNRSTLNSECNPCNTFIFLIFFFKLRWCRCFTYFIVRVNLPRIPNKMFGHALIRPGAGTPAVMVLTTLGMNIPVSSPEGLILGFHNKGTHSVVAHMFYFQLNFQKSVGSTTCFRRTSHSSIVGLGCNPLYIGIYMCQEKQSILNYFPYSVK